MNTKLKVVLIMVAELLVWTLAASAQTKPPHAPLAEQKMCAEQAKKIFQEFKYPYFEGTLVLNNDYTSHYDTLRKVCFVRIDYVAHDNNGSNTRDVKVIDAFEHRIEAAYLSIDQRGLNKIEEVCFAGDSECKDYDGFEALASKTYGLR